MLLYMTETELIGFLAATNKYTPAEAAAELDSLRTGEWDSMQVSDTDGTVYLITYDPEAGNFTVTDNFSPAGPR